MGYPAHQILGTSVNGVSGVLIIGSRRLGWVHYCIQPRSNLLDQKTPARGIILSEIAGNFWDCSLEVSCVNKGSRASVFARCKGERKSGTTEAAKLNRDKFWIMGSC